MSFPESPPFSPTERVESVHRDGPPDRDPEGSSAGRWLAIGLLLLSVTLISAGVGFLLSGGQLPASGTASTPASTPDAQVAAQSTAHVATQPVAPTQEAPPAAAPAPSKPTATPTTAPARPTAPPQPTSAPPTAAAAAPAPKPSAAAAAPNRDPRIPEIEARIHDYFAALNAQDYARAHQVCCTDAWRARYPLDRWERNFDGVSDLHLEGEPRYLRVEPDIIVVDTDYTFVSGGRQRDFTLRWTFQPVGGAWQAELAEAFAR
jgi:hypothetical protein